MSTAYLLPSTGMATVLEDVDGVPFNDTAKSLVDDPTSGFRQETTDQNNPCIASDGEEVTITVLGLPLTTVQFTPPSTPIEP
ncbi:MAG: hypothetical protein H6550_16330 [Chitinophagales bacterium]|nr:hypothetical protein [Chitinophagales bacterium]